MIGLTQSLILKGNTEPDTRVNTEPDTEGDRVNTEPDTEG